MFNTKIRCCTFLQAYISIFIFFLILFLQCENFFLLMLSKTVMFPLMNLRIAHSFITPTITSSSSSSSWSSWSAKRSSYYFTLTIISRWVVPDKLQWKNFKIWFSLPGFIRYIWFELRFALRFIVVVLIRGLINKSYSITSSIMMLIKSVSCYRYTAFCNLAKKIWFANLCFQNDKVIISIIKFNGYKFNISGKRSPAFVFGLVQPYFWYQPKPTTTTTCFSCGGWNYRYM